MFLPFYLFVLLVAKSPSVILKAQTLPPAFQHPMTSIDPTGPGEQTTQSPGTMSMFSVYVPPDPERPKQSLLVRCKVGRAFTSVDRRVTIDGVVQEDVVSGVGKILIPAGSTVVGQGYSDSDRNRILAGGRWTFYLSDHQITIEGTLWSNEQQEGLTCQATRVGSDESKIKQAVYNSGIHVSEGTDFVLRLTGNISVRDLGSAYEK